MYRLAVILCATLCLSACETPTTQRYAISADNMQALQTVGKKGIGVGSMTAPAEFSANCRLLGPMRVADGLTHTQYIQRALEAELKVAGAYLAESPRVLLSGAITRLEFSSSRAVTGGSWTIDLALKSSNGQALQVAEYYEFESGFAANDACRNTAEAFSRAVQNLIGKTFGHSKFAELVR